MSEMRLKIVNSEVQHKGMLGASLEGNEEGRMCSNVLLPCSRVGRPSSQATYDFRGSSSESVPRSKVVISVQDFGS